MQEEADAVVDPALAQFAGEGQQMVIMDPQRIIWLECCGRPSTIVLIWSASSAKPGRDISELTPCWRTSFDAVVDPALAQFAGEGQQMVIMDPQRIIWLDQR
jgi:predicted nicotinamide N-methyase